MMHILSRAHRGVIEQFAWSRVLLAFDFDGTLAPIVEEPSEAQMTPTTRALLATAALAYPCAVISGRSHEDVLGRLRGVDVLDVVGNHGAEPFASANQSSGAAKKFARIVAGWSACLEKGLADLQGVEIEDKGLSIAVHYRKSRQRREARKSVDALVATLVPSARVIEGKLALNITPQGAPNKGVALQQLREKRGADTAVYVGDEETDEDVFTLDEPGRLLSIRIGRSRTSAAPYYLRSQGEVDDLLGLFIARRRLQQLPHGPMGH